MIPISFRGFPLNAAGLTSQFRQWYGRPGLRPVEARRQGAAPLITGVEQELWQLPALELMIDDEAADFDALRLGILRTFDTREGAGALILADDDGGNERYVMAVCQEPTQQAGQGGDVFVATLVVSGEQYWRSTATMTGSGALTATGQTLTVENDGELDAYPVASYMPTVGRSGNDHWKYRRFVVVPWRSTSGAGNYSSLLNGDNTPWDTTALTPTKAVDGSSVGVLVDGNEVNRWFGPVGAVDEVAFDEPNTLLWTNLDFQSGLLVTLTVSLGSNAGDVAGGIRVNEDISAFPPSGILYAAGANELFYYLSRDVKRRTFHGVTRAAYGSTAASHSAAATLEWIQHEVFIVYGPATGLAMETDDAYQPLIDLDISRNGEWDWFGQTVPISLGSAIITRPGGWRSATEGMGAVFTLDQNIGSTEPHEVLGVANETPGAANTGQWQIYCPAAIHGISLDFQIYETTEVEALKVYLSLDGINWTLSASAPAAGATGAGWYGWSFSRGNQTANWRYVKFEISGAVGMAQLYQGFVSFESELAPAVRLMPEVTNYALDVAITNETTGEGIELRYPAGLAVGDAVEVDSEGKTVVAEPFGRNIYQAMTKSSHRPAMLRLVPGENVLRVDEAGLAGADVIVTWQERFYS